MGNIWLVRAKGERDQTVNHFQQAALQTGGSRVEGDTGR
jgi:hypothetical protein